MAAVTIGSDFGAPKIKSLTVSIVSQSICHEVPARYFLKNEMCLVAKILFYENWGKFSLDIKKKISLNPQHCF